MKELKSNGEKIKIIDLFSENNSTLLERIYNFSPDIKQSINLLINELDLSLDFPYSIFLSGSYAFSSRSNVFNDIKTLSDIDIWVIVSDLEFIKRDKNNLYSKIISGLDDYDMFMYKWDIDCRFSIKFVKDKTIRDLFINDKNHLKVVRSKSLLVKKKTNIFFGIFSYLLIKFSI